MDKRAQLVRRWLSAVVIVAAVCGGRSAAQDAGADGAPPPKKDPVVTTERDKEILKRTKNKKLVHEAQSWNRARIGPHSDIEQVCLEAYAAGAPQVWADLEGQKRFKPAKLYIELPDGEARKLVIERVTVINEIVKLPRPEPVKDDKQRYLVVDIAAMYAKQKPKQKEEPK